MDELELLKAHTEAHPGPSRETVLRARSRLLASMRRPRQPAFRFMLPALGAGAAAVLAVTIGVSSPGIVDGKPPGTGSTKSVSAVTVLERAAETAADESHRAPRGDQYAFVETRALNRFTMGDWEGEVRRFRTRVWIPVDGSKPRLAASRTNGGAWERSTVSNGDAPESPLRDSYQALDRLPRDPDKLLAQLRQRVDKRGAHPADDQVFNMIAEELVTGSVAPPGVRATLFRAMAKLPGVVVKRNAVDAADRSGIAVTHVDVHVQTRTELIFDPASYELLGNRQVVAQRPRTGATPSPTVAPMTEPPGTVLYSSAVLRTAIVDDAWQLP